MKTAIDALVTSVMFSFLLPTIAVASGTSSTEHTSSEVRRAPASSMNPACEGTARVTDVEAISAAKTELARRAESYGKVFNGSGLRFEVAELESCDLAVTIVTDKHRTGRISTMILSRTGQVKSYIGGM